MLVASHVPGYDDAIAFLLARIDYERLPPAGYRNREYKLDRMRQLLHSLDDPQQHLKIVHIAGTKGKGSTTAMLASIAAAAGLRVGAFTSPHLDRVEQRIAINGQACRPDELVQLVQCIRPVVEGMDEEARLSSATGDLPRSLTFFELTTAMAMLHFTRCQVDLAILEVGMGGRLDATNVCQPLCTAITSISYDHTLQLGNTLAKIAAEKAGIIKDGVPVVSGVTSLAARAVIVAKAAEHQAPLLQREDDFQFSYCPPIRAGSGMTEGGGEQPGSPVTDCPGGVLEYHARNGAAGRSLSDVRLSLLGRHQAANAAVVLAIVGVLERQGFQFPEAAIRHGLAGVVCPARIELVHRRPFIVVDAAHNVASIEALLNVLDECYPALPRLLVFASTRGKDLRGMLSLLVPKFDRIFLTCYRNNPRGVPTDELTAIVNELRSAASAPQTGIAAPQPSVIVYQDPPAAWQAVQSAATPDCLICITGSFFIAAEMRQLIVADVQQPDQPALGGEPPRAQFKF